MPKKKQQWFILEKFYTLDNGIYDAISFINLFITQKYHNYFNLPEFLITYVAFEDRHNSNVNLILRNLKLSRLNFILNGTYLPIILKFGDNLHEIAVVFLPRFFHNAESDTADQNNITFWQRIEINSNGEPMSLITSQTNEAFEKYRKFVSFQTEKKYKTAIINCQKNIQKDFGTCASWSHFLAVQLLAHYEHFIQQAKESVNQNEGVVKIIQDFCEKLSLHLNNSLAIQKYNEVIVDFMIAVNCSIVTLIGELKKLGQQATVTSIMSAIDRDEGARQHLRLFQKLFEITNVFRGRFSKHVMGDFEETRTISDKKRHGQRLWNTFAHKIRNRKAEVKKKKPTKEDED